jgi:hypothetical protein
MGPTSLAEIDIESDREKAKESALALSATSNAIIYSDASGHNNHLGAAAVVIERITVFLTRLVICRSQLSTGSIQISTLTRYQDRLWKRTGGFYT